MNKTVRLQHLVTLLRSRRSATLALLMEETGVSRATLMRDLAWLRDELRHPIQYDKSSGTYRWRPAASELDAPQELPGLWFKPSEILALLTLQHLIHEVEPGDLLHRHLAPIEERLRAMADLHGVPTPEVFQRIRVIGPGQRKVAPGSFETVGAALVQRKQVSFSYLARVNGEHSHRTVSPQRLIYYRHNWMLDAWCHQRKQLRSFSLDNIRDAKILVTPAIDLPEEDLNQVLGNGYGIFSGKAVQWVTLRFTPERARWVSTEQWHKEQMGEWDSEGHWLLTLPYSDDRELVMDILRHIPQVEVLAPASLRTRVLEMLQQGLALWTTLPE